MSLYYKFDFTDFITRHDDLIPQYPMIYLRTTYTRGWYEKRGEDEIIERIHKNCKSDNDGNHGKK